MHAGHQESASEPPPPDGHRHMTSNLFLCLFDVCIVYYVLYNVFEVGCDVSLLTVCNFVTLN